jgi:uncharacterized membrane protein (UPF0127 family)
VSSFLGPLRRAAGSAYSLVNVRSGSVIAEVVEPALDSKSRRKGLLGRDALADSHALVLAPCGAVHTFGMRFPIDVLFVAADGCVIKIVERLGAWRMAASLQACITVELPTGAVQRNQVLAGDRLVIQSRASTSAKT